MESVVREELVLRPIYAAILLVTSLVLEPKEMVGRGR